MNDSHVVALHYSIEHASWIDYSKTEPLTFRDQAFEVRVADKRVQFVMNDHFSTEQEAREAVKHFILGWEIDVALKRCPGAFKLRFDKSDIVDRNPMPGAICARLNPVRFVVSTGQPHATFSPCVSPRDYPKPPTTGLAPSPDVESMFLRYVEYCEGKEPLAAMAYFCLTVFESTMEQRRGQRAAAAKQYCIDKRVLDRLGNLTANKGGPRARKAKGVDKDFTPEEKRFVEAAVKMIIRRTAEVAHDPKAELSKILVDDFSPRE